MRRKLIVACLAIVAALGTNVLFAQDSNKGSGMSLFDDEASTYWQ